MMAKPERRAVPSPWVAPRLVRPVVGLGRLVPVDSRQVDVPARVVEAGPGIGVRSRAPAGYGWPDFPIAPDVLV